MKPIIVGENGFTRLIDGGERRITCFNNAATTPPFAETLSAVNKFLATYGALHRGAGPRARATVEAVEAAIATIREFIGATASHHLLFTDNTSSGLNLLARMLRLEERDVVIISDIEHTSNNLPWRYNTKAKIVEAPADDSGRLILGNLRALAQQHQGKLKVIAVTGASNLSGAVSPLSEIAAISAQAGALLVVDGAQLAPHRPISLSASGIDVLAFSAHKLYAPFGLGVLALPRQLLDQAPVNPAGGSIDMFSSRGAIWSPAEERHQSGTWNAVGIIALAESMRLLKRYGWGMIQEHEKNITQMLLQGLKGIKGCELYIHPRIFESENRIGTLPFNINGLHHSLLASALEHEFAIEVRAGTICNHRLVARWLGVSEQEQRRVEEEIKKGNRLATYGVVRASVGLQNTAADVEALVGALEQISSKGLKLHYNEGKSGESFEPHVPLLPEAANVD